ncbi:MAG: hypothetical protein JXB25_09955 [Deltaproteobacteria bacterium]|nr:hypothetical protein [Deltaproteobacteria bacterium]
MVTVSTRLGLIVMNRYRKTRRNHFQQFISGGFSPEPTSVMVTEKNGMKNEV